MFKNHLKVLSEISGTINFIRLSAGTREKPFQDKHSIVVTETFAKKHFGDDNPLGKVITREDEKESYTVTGN